VDLAGRREVLRGGVPARGAVGGRACGRPVHEPCGKILVALPRFLFLSFLSFLSVYVPPPQVFQVGQSLDALFLLFNSTLWGMQQTGDLAYNARMAYYTQRNVAWYDWGNYDNLRLVLLLVVFLLPVGEWTDANRSHVVCALAVLLKSPFLHPPAHPTPLSPSSPLSPRQVCTYLLALVGTCLWRPGFFFFFFFFVFFFFFFFCVRGYVWVFFI
jgi:hypothetical protein